jgi:hypothetical protein
MRLLVAALFLAQAATAPSFEVASINPHPVPPGVFAVARNAANLKIAGNRVTFGGNLKSLVMAAYNVKDFQVDGVPEAFGSELYDVVAKTEGEATPSVGAGPPDAANLAGRSIPTPTASRNQANCGLRSGGSEERPEVEGKHRAKALRGPGEKDPVKIGTAMRWSFTDRTIAGLIDLIKVTVDRPILDKTGLTGRYDFSIELDMEHPQEIQQSLEDLGLKLNSAKEPAEVLVIDHAAKPSAN